ncbi:MAG: LPS-assembly protein LptD [Candidatus Omnitrophica bacterium]|nr:LPS-assembly protein LptD [Candidatus Omnitrophota bacterium]
MKRITRIILIIALLTSQVYSPELASAQGDFGFFDEFKQKDEPVVVKGDKVEYFQDQNKVVGQGNVSIGYGDIELRCDKITVYTDTKEAICEGNVIIAQPGAAMEGEKIHYNFSTKTGYVLDGKMQAEPIYGKAGKLEQTADQIYKIEKGHFTTCDLEKPHYRVEAKEIIIYLHDKVVAKHVVMYIGRVPVFYLPIYVQPLLEEMPEVTLAYGRRSEWGYYVLSAWRYYFNENSKGNIHIDYRTKLGLSTGIDYKYDAKELGQGVLRAYHTFQGQLAVIGQKPEDEEYKVKRDRWRVQYIHAINLPENTNAILEFNQMSDKYFYKQYFYREYEENPKPETYLLLTTQKPNYTMNFYVRKRINKFFDVVERLPELELVINNQRLWNTNFYYKSADQAAYLIRRFERDVTIPPPAAQKAFRADTYQRLSYAARFFKCLSVTPYIAARLTYYSQNRWKVRNQLRNIFEGGVDFSTKIYRTFNVNTNFLQLDINRLRHIITPKIGFFHRPSPSISPSNLSQFDGIDTYEKDNRFIFQIENKLQTKREESAGVEKTIDLANFIVETDYIFRLKKRSLMPQRVGRFTDFRFHLEVYPYPWFSLVSDMEVDHKYWNVNTARNDLYIDFGEKFTLGIGHSYQSYRDDFQSDVTNTSYWVHSNSITGQVTYRLNEKWKFQIYQSYDLQDQRVREQQYTIYRDLHCWTAEASYDIRTQTVNGISELDHIFWLTFTLKAFPDIPVELFKTTYRRSEPGAMR